MNDIIFLQVVPHDLYFVWQIDVQCHHFRKHKISDKMHICVWYPNMTLIPKWQELQNKYPEVNFKFYKDDGVNLGLYIPQLRPHTLKKHFAIFPELSKKIIFYHDSDILFNRLPDFNSLSEGDVNWQSNTTNYLDYSYLKRKEEQGNIPEGEAIKTLADIGGITSEVFKQYDGKTGGAQYILKGINANFWQDVENQVIRIRKAFYFHQPNSINHKYFHSEEEGFQSWCADMWAVNMALWSRGKATDITPELDFSWGTDNIETYKQRPIFHLAGVVNSMNGQFYKGEWINESPIGSKKLKEPSKSSATHMYYLEIKELENNL